MSKPASPVDQLKQSMMACNERVVAEIEQFFDSEAAHFSSLPGPFQASMGGLKTYVTRGGKMIRPWLVVESYLVAGGSQQNLDRVWKVATAVELFHRYISNLDDMTDRDEMRYGQPTLEVQYRTQFSHTADAVHHGRSLSSIDGALLHTMAYQLLSSAGLSQSMFEQVMRLVTDFIFVKTVAGWQVHYYQNLQKLDSLPPTSLADYMEGLALVSSSYTFNGPLLIGLCLAELDPASHDTFSKIFSAYSQAIGTVFQMGDDILGVIGDPAVTGKPVGNDIREGKKTWLMQTAYATAKKAGNGSDCELLLRACGNKNLSNEMLSSVVGVFNKYGVLDAARSLIAEHGNEAIAHVAGLKSSQQLVTLAQFLQQREK